MTEASENYLLAGGAAELERLQLQARVWEPEAEVMLDQIGLQAGWQCLDLGCEAMGILGPLSRRAGPTGRVVGVDLDVRQLAAARAFVQEAGLHNVEIMEQDAYHTGFPPQSFDLVHVRFVFAPSGRDEDLLGEMVALTKPGASSPFRSRMPLAGTAFPTMRHGTASKVQYWPPSSKGVETSMLANTPMACCDRRAWKKCASERR
jgi:ubiquinone/menaquinone biosynthesis C-methylase UbiE